MIGCHRNKRRRLIAAECDRAEPYWGHTRAGRDCLTCASTSANDAAQGSLRASGDPSATSWLVVDAHDIFAHSAGRCERTSILSCPVK